MEKPRVNLGKAAPEAYRAVDGLDKLARDMAASAGFATGFVHLLKLRASQLNQCAFCVRMHTRDALKAGETSDRVSVIAAWRESEYFTDKERAALLLAEAVTQVSEGQISDAVYSEAANHLDEHEIAAVEWVAIVINAWNRIAIGSRYPVKP